MVLKPKTRSINILLAFCAFCLLCLAVFSRAETSLNGLASYQYLGKERFIAALYSENRANRPEALLRGQHRRMEIRCTNSFSARQQIRTWIEGAAINNSASQLENHAASMVKFTQLINTSLQPGDQILIDSPVDSPVTISLNTVELGQIAATGFFDVLLQSWIGKVPPSSTFRKNLLAEGIVDQQLQQRFDAIHPSEDRILFAQTLIGAPLETEPTEITDDNIEPSLATDIPQAAESNAETPTITPSNSAVSPAPTTPTSEPVTLAPLTTAPNTIDSEPSSAEPEKAEVDTALISVEPADSNDQAPDSPPLLDADTLLQQQLYHSDLLRMVNQAVKYPRRAISRNHEGRVTLQVRIDNEGAVQQIETLDASDHNTLNRAAEKAVEAAAPFPAPPMELNDEDYVFTVPIEFRLQ